MCRLSKWGILSVFMSQNAQAFIPRTFSLGINRVALEPVKASDISSLEQNDSETLSPSEGGSGGLTFIAETVVRSDKVQKCSPSQLLSFMDIEENLASLVTAGAKNPFEVVADPSEELVSNWQLLAKQLGGAEPTASDRILKVQTGVIQLPGLKLFSEAVIGTKIVASDNNQDFPFYEFCLIDDTNTVKGPKPLVAIFNALTGSNKKDKKRTSPTSLTRVSVENEEDGSIVFQTKGFLKIVVKFPTFLFRILPVSKEKAEEQGSEAIEKAIVRDTEASTAYFRNKYEAWVNAQ